MKKLFFRLSDERNRIKFLEEEEKIVLFIFGCKEIGINLNSNLIIDEFCRIWFYIEAIILLFNYNYNLNKRLILLKIFQYISLYLND